LAEAAGPNIGVFIAEPRSPKKKELATLKVFTSLSQPRTPVPLQLPCDFRLLGGSHLRLSEPRQRSKIAGTTK
jgi:hypothetical protein